jgi:TatD DNase family protein
MIDTHCHLDNIKYQDDVDIIIQNALNIGVKAFLIPGANLDDLPKAVKLSEKYEEIFFAVGVHPYDCDNFDISILEKYVNHPKCIAIGECGLDYFRLPKDEDAKSANIKLQKDIFIQQINFAKKVNKPLIVHIRDASDDSKIILIDHQASKVGGVLHCFNADPQLSSLANDGFYFGIGGVVTFKNAKQLREILPKIPQDKLIIETDSPYLTPHPFRGERNEPKYTYEIAQKLSDILNISLESVKYLTTTNAKKLFKEFNSIN